MQESPKRRRDVRRAQPVAVPKHNHVAKSGTGPSNNRICITSVRAPMPTLCIPCLEFPRRPQQHTAWMVTHEVIRVYTFSLQSVDGDSKPDTRGSSRRRVNSGVHPNHSSDAVQQRSAGVPRIDSCVCLNDVADGSTAR